MRINNWLKAHFCESLFLVKCLQCESCFHLEPFRSPASSPALPPPLPPLFSPCLSGTRRK